MKSWLSEPLVHFLVLGGVLFAVHAMWSGARDRAAYEIVVTPEEMARQATLFAGENRRQPTDADLQALMLGHVEEQVLAREAVRLGLDADDTVIRRRLAQKMRFMIRDAGAPPLPSEADLRDWFDANRADFAQAERRSFDHIYLSPKTREAVEADAETLLSSLQDTASQNTAPQDTSGAWQSLGDPFMNPRSVRSRSQDDIRRDYGTAFAQRLFALPTTPGWQGPVESAFGLHLVRITEVEPAAQPAFETVREAVEDAWLDAAELDANRRALTELIEKYDVVVAE